MAEDVNFTTATDADAAAIVGLRHRIWGTTYRGIYPDQMLDDFAWDWHHEQELRRLELEFEKLQARNDTIHDRFFDESITKADYQRAKARSESEMNHVQEKIAAIKHRQTLNTDTQTLKPDIRAAITGIVSGRTADDDFYGHLLQQMTVYRDGRVEVALNLLPAKWVYVLDGLEKYRAQIGVHDASSVPMSVSRPLSSG